MNIGTQELGIDVYRKLLYFYQHNIPVHFSLVRGGWKNGLIRDLNGRTLSIVLREYKEGTLIFLCEEINPESIEEYREKSRVVKV